MAKALLIKSAEGEKDSVQGAWQKFEHSSSYIQGIETGNIMEHLDSQLLNGMVSGLPSVWARAFLFKYAFNDTKKDANIQTSGLIKYYESLIEEWKGLAALMAIYPDRITVGEPLYLNNKPDDIYDISSSFGDMLFDDRDLWSNPDKLANKEDENPYIQIIRYNGEPVGATSPYTLFFTSVDFSNFAQSQDVKWFRNGRLCDPLVYGDLNNDKIQKLYLLVSNFVDKLPEYGKLINKNRGGKEELLINPIFEFCKKWQQEIAQKGSNLVSEGELDGKLKFAAPFTELFSIKQDIYYKNGTFSFNPEDGGEIVDLQQLLLQDEYLIYFYQDDDCISSLDNSAVYYMKAMDPNEAGRNLYFPVPLSSYGLNIFKHKIGELVSPSGPNSHEIMATVKDKTVLVELKLQVDGRKLPSIIKEYKKKIIDGSEGAVIMWPNFVSKDWTSYYLYNEYPSNNSDIKFVPFYRKYNEFGGYDSGEFITDNKKNLVYADDPSEDVQAQTIVRYPVEIATADNRPYEIIRSNKPFAGIEIRSRENGKDRICGYLIVKQYNSEDSHVKDLSHESNFENVIVGIDFGSNNSCMSYSLSGQSQVNPIQFENRRVFLSGSESYDPKHEKIARRDELLFFQNESSPNGQIKSWVHDHDRKYVPEGMQEEEISGGVPIFEPNLVIHSMDERTIKTNAGTLHHNMKWLSDAAGKEKKKAFLKSLWISAVADLYADRKMPSELRWSYPGAFSPFDILQYSLMYKELAKVPIEGHRVQVTDHPSTEAEAVCNYALTNVRPDSNNLMLGIDVGGSTSDVLILAMDRASRSFKLTKQSSLRLAAGMFVNVIPQSEDFRRAVNKFHESPACKFKVANIRNIIDKPETSPFYLNAVLDRLKEEEFDAFYSTLSQSCPQVFAVPAYITGLLLFYSGKLAAKTIKDNGYSIRYVDLLPFGKGGRLFDWLDVYPGKQMASEYYNKCFRTGYGEGGQDITVTKKDSIRKDNKSEVSKGLSAPQKTVMDDNIRLNSDVIGETGYKYYPEGSNEPKLLTQDDIASSEYLSELDFGIEIPPTFDEFNKFLDIFSEFVGPNMTGILKNISVISKNRTELPRELKNYITADPEWQKADTLHKQGQNFDFRHSLLVLEGMCFLDKFIIPEIR